MRNGESVSSVAARLGVARSTVRLWVKRARGKRLDRVDFSDRPHGPRRPANRAAADIEDLVLVIRRELREESALGESGALAIRRALKKRCVKSLPSVRTIGRILLRRGALDGRRRVSFKLGVLNNIVHIASVVRWADRLIEDSDVLGMIRILYFLSETFDGRLAFKIGRRFAQSSARGTVFLHERPFPPTCIGSRLCDR